MEVANTQSNFNINQLNDNLLAGLYANGYTNLENINNELFNSILNWGKIFAKLDNSSTDSASYNELSLITSVISSLINKQDGNILFVVSDTTQLEKYYSQFKKISSYIESVNTRTIQEESDARLIVSDVTSINSNIENVKYIVVNNCITKRLVKNLKYKNVNIAFLSTEINDNVIENVKKITGDDTVESNTESAVVESNTESTVVESNTESTVVESNTESAVVESNTESTVVESNTASAVVESNTESAVVESNTESAVVESNTESAVVESNTESTVVESNTESAVVESNTESAVVESNTESTVVESNTESAVVESNTESTVVESNTESAVVESNTESAVVESNTESTVVESNTESTVVESNTESAVVESNTESTVVESNTESTVVESNTESAVVEESQNEIELSTPIQRDEQIESDSDSGSEYDLNEIISQLNIPSLSFQEEAKKQKIKNHNKKLLLQMRSRGLRR